MIINNIPDGSMLLTPHDARLIYQAANIRDVRGNFAPDTATGRALLGLSKCAFHSVAVTGIETRQSVASEEPENWTIERLHRATGRAPRTIRKDIADRLLPATKQGNTWIITNDEARAYIAGRRKN